MRSQLTMHCAPKMPCICILYITGDVFLIRKHKKRLSFSSVFNDQCHEHKICITGIGQCMSASIRCKCHITGFYRADSSIVVIIALSGQDVIRLTFSMMFMVTKGTPRLQSHFRVKPALSIHLFFSENMLDPQLFLSLSLNAPHS